MILAKAQGYIGGGGGHRTEKKYTGRGGHRTYFLDWVNDWSREVGGGHRTYFVDEGNNWDGDIAQH